jgi:CHAT domain-containing protein
MPTVALAILLVTTTPTQLKVWHDSGILREIEPGETAIIDLTNCENFEVLLPDVTERTAVIATTASGFFRFIWPHQYSQALPNERNHLRLTAYDVFFFGPPVTSTCVLHIVELDADRNIADLTAEINGDTHNFRYRTPWPMPLLSYTDAVICKVTKPKATIIFTSYEQFDFSHLALDKEAKQHLLNSARQEQLRNRSAAAFEANRALEKLRVAYETDRFPGSHENVAIAHLRVARTMTAMGHFDVARKHINDAREVIKLTFVDRHSAYETLLVASAELHVARVHFAENDFEGCIQHAEKAQNTIALVNNPSMAFKTVEVQSSAMLLEVAARYEITGDDKNLAANWHSVIDAVNSYSDAPELVLAKMRATTLLVLAKSLYDKRRFGDAGEAALNAVRIVKTSGAVDLGSRVIMAEAMMFETRSKMELGQIGAATARLNQVLDLVQLIEESEKDLNFPFLPEIYEAVATSALRLSNPHIIRPHLPKIENRLANFHPQTYLTAEQYLFTTLAVASIETESPAMDRQLAIRRAITRTEKEVLPKAPQLIAFALLCLAEQELLAQHPAAAREALSRFETFSKIPILEFRARMVEAGLVSEGGDTVGALRIVQESIAHAGETIKPDELLLATEFASRQARQLGDFALAETYASQSFDLYLEHLEKLVSETNAAEYQRKRGTAKRFLDKLLADGIASKSPPEKLWQVIAKFYQADYATRTSDRGKEDELLSHRKDLDLIWQATLLDARPSKRGAEVEQALAEIATLERGTLYIPRAEKDLPAKVDVDNRKQAGGLPASQWLVHRMEQEGRAFIIFLHQAEDGRVDSLVVDAEPFLAKLQRWRDVTIDHGEAEAELEWLSASLKPLLQQVQGSLTISGDPLIFEMPWAAFWVGKERLLEVASIRVDGGGVNSGNGGLTAKSRALIIGDVRFPKDGAVQDLPFSADEISRIRTHFDSVTLGVRDTPTREWTMDALQRAEFAHFATHGVGRNTVRLLGQGEAAILADSPFLGSGLLLASGSADRAEILTAATVANLPLSNMKLVVLSACESAVGASDMPGFSLPRAFHMAGANTVVSTQWPVDDQATSVLMRMFYANLMQEHLPPAEALRQAQLTILRNPEQIQSLSRLRAPDFTKAATKLRRGTGKPRTKKYAPPRAWAGFLVSESLSN